jgi:hypothetical protein
MTASRCREQLVAMALENVPQLLGRPTGHVSDDGRQVIEVAKPDRLEVGREVAVKGCRKPRRVVLIGDRGCSFSNSVADGDAFTVAFAEFSPKWRTAFSYIRGGSYNRAVVHKSLPEQASRNARSKRLPSGIAVVPAAE